MMAPAAQVRAAAPGDLTAITAIYNDAVMKTTATMDVEPRSLEDRARWMEQHTGRYAVLVADASGAGVVGWASLTRWSDKLAYDGTCESSVYVAEAWRGKGVGRALMVELLREADRSQFHNVLARVTTDNVASIRLHERVGFVRVGVMHEVGFKFGRKHDVLVLERLRA